MWITTCKCILSFVDVVENLESLFFKTWIFSTKGRTKCLTFLLFLKSQKREIFFSDAHCLLIQHYGAVCRLDGATCWMEYQTIKPTLAGVWSPYINQSVFKWNSIWISIFLWLQSNKNSLIIYCWSILSTCLMALNITKRIKVCNCVPLVKRH